MELPKTLQQAIKSFANPDYCQDLMIKMRWPDGKVVCPRCGSDNVAYLEKARLFKCYGKHEKAKFSLKVGTIFEDSPIGLDKWLMAMWLIANCKNGISSYELHRAIGVTQKSAWFILHRIRLAMQTGSIEKLSGTVEADETFVGGLTKNMHTSKRKDMKWRFGARGHQTAIMGMIERKGRVRARVVADVQKKTLQEQLRENVEEGSTLMTDQWVGYNNLENTYIRETINHTFEYVREHVHTNSIENFWSLLKRSIKETYVSVSPEHLQKYVEEQAFRFNERKGKDHDRFLEVLASISGKRLTYQQLIGYEISQ
jgi:transposase-like protein